MKAKKQESDDHFVTIMMYYVTITVISGYTTDMRQCLEDCHEGIQGILSMEESMHQSGFIQESGVDDQGIPQLFHPGIVKLESSLLNLGALDNVCQGVFYLQPITCEEVVYLR